MKSYNRFQELHDILLQYFHNVHYTVSWQHSGNGLEPMPGWYINLPNGNIEFIEHPDDDVSNLEFEIDIVFQKL